MGEEDKKHDHEEHEKHHHEEHEGNKHVYMEHHEHKKHQSYKIATWILAGVSIVLLIGLIISLAMPHETKTSTKVISIADAKAQTETYLKSIANGNASVDSITDIGDLYNVQITVSGRAYESYVTKDGKLLFPQGIDMTQAVPATDNTAANTQAAPTVVPKTDKPAVELFVMSYCPYGTQAEKGILPAVRALGDSIDFKIRFVYYSMHGLKEVKENLNQYCIQSQQPDKYEKYLACFLNDSVGQGSDAAVTACIASSGIDTTKLNACKTATDTQFNVMANYNNQSSWLNGQFPKFDIDAALNTKYSVGGSPTLIINGVESNAGRDSASFLAGICAAFNTPPAACQTQLSSTTPGAGFGYDSVGAANAAGCGV
jgi:hypothetical protein